MTIFGRCIKSEVFPRPMSDDLSSSYGTVPTKSSNENVRDIVSMSPNLSITIGRRDQYYF